LPQPSHLTYEIADLHDTADLNLRWPVASNIFLAAVCPPILLLNYIPSLCALIVFSKLSMAFATRGISST
jgi:hypothetical protein